MIKLLIGGSPCTYWSIAQKNGRETEAEGLGWELFKNYLIAKEKFKPDLFLYENNKSASKAIKDQIKKELKVWDGTMFIEDTGARYIEINSALVSAQNRQRFYVHNCGEVEQPEDRGILLSNILSSGITYQDKAWCLTANYSFAVPVDFFKSQRSQVFEISETPTNICVKNGVLHIEHNSSRTDKHDIYIDTRMPDGYYTSRKFTLEECCRLQTMPDDYCRAVSPAQAYKGLGNGWTAEVIIHILNGALKDIPKDEEIVVLSMYDGIGTGRYCLDKMGFKNIKYYAYEIDKYAKQIAMSNYPDIIQMGDAFQVRELDWETPCK